jgi:hypothetical protein
MAAKSPSAHLLLAFVEALVRAALHGRLRAIVEIVNRIEGRVANEFEAQPVDDGPAAAARRLMIKLVTDALKETGRTKRRHPRLPRPVPRWKGLPPALRDSPEGAAPGVVSPTQRLDL